MLERHISEDQETGFPGGRSSAPAPVSFSKTPAWPGGKSIGRDALWSQALGLPFHSPWSPPSTTLGTSQGSNDNHLCCYSRGRCAKLCPHPHCDPKVSLILVPILQTRKVKPREAETESQKAQTWEGLDWCPAIG